MKTNAFEPINPATITLNCDNENETVNRQIGSSTYETYGLTKREHFAAIAMQGYCGGEFTGQSGMDVSDIAKWSVNMADALIEALNK